MSTETLEKEAVEVKAPREALLSKRRKGFVTDPLDDNNPITVQILGICSALAVTSQIMPTFIMSVSVIAVMVFANLIISLIRNLIPSRIRIIAQLGIVATLVAIVDMVLKAYAYDVSKSLSVFVGLIITNCIVMGRLEAFAMGNKAWDSVLDGLGSGFGYAWVILVIAFFRELFGAGKVAGIQIIPQAAYELGYVNNGVMSIPVGAFVILGLIIWVQRANNGYVEE